MKRLKNITLVTLILISVLLFSRVWFGTNFIEEIKNNITFARAAHESETKNFTVENILTPENIIITGGGKRNVLSKGMDGYNELFERMLSAVGKLGINEEKFFETKNDDWTAALKSRSVFFDFAAAYDAAIIDKLGIKLPEGLYENVVFVPSDSIAVNAMVYVKNSVNGKIYKFMSESGNEELEKIINQYAVSAEAVNSPFAFELGFDKAKTNTEISQNVLLDSNIIVGLTEKYANNAELYVGDGDFSQRTVERLLELFKFNRNTTRRYVDKDDVTVFVDNTATLKIYPSYLIEYTSEVGGYSFETAAAKETVSSYVSSVYGMVREGFRAAETGEMPMLVSSELNSESEKSDIKITFDYYVNGMPVLIDGENEVEHGVTAVLSSGTLKSYKQYLFEVSQSGNTENIGSMINALDLLYEKFKNEKEVKLSKIFTAYETDRKTMTLKPVWCAKTGKETIIINDEND